MPAPVATTQRENSDRDSWQKGTEMCRHNFVKPILILAIALTPVTVHAGFLDTLKGAISNQGVSTTAGLTDSDVTRGLKQALEKGTERTVSKTGRRDGYWKNSDIQIPLPESLATATRLLDGIGMGALTSDLKLRMNRAAEAAAPLARPIFIDAITKMQLSDVQKIWKGPDDAATRYFKEKTKAKLSKSFAPVIHRELERVEAVKSYQKLSSQYAGIPLVGQKLNLDLDGYVTDKALDGLFFTLAKEEAEIRKNPAARTTDLLKRVFR